MKYRFIELLGLRDIDADGTTTIDLDMSDPISEILIDSRLTNGAEANSAGHWLSTITKIEIVDGSDVLFSLDGLEMEALDIYHSGIFPRSIWSNYFSWQSADRQNAISFGRWLWDDILAFDPKRFRNPQLKITFDIDAGGMNPSKCELSVLAAVFDEKVITPVGFLMSKEIKQWTTTASAHEYTDLPTDHPYRKLLIACRYAGTSPNSMISNIKLSEDQDKKIIVNGEFRDLIFGIGRENAFIHEQIGCPVHASSTRTFHVTPTMGVVGMGTEWDGTLHGDTIAVTGGAGGRINTLCDQAANYNIVLTGYAPHGALQIPFGRQDQIEDWFDVSGIGSLKLDITDGTSSGTGKIFIQQLRKY